MNDDLPNFDDVLRLVAEDWKSRPEDGPMMEIVEKKVVTKLVKDFPFVDYDVISNSARRARDIHLHLQLSRGKHRERAFAWLQECLDESRVTALGMIAMQEFTMSWHFLFVHPFFGAFERAGRIAKARKGGVRRHSGKQFNKTEVRKYWERWQKEPQLYRSQEEFSLDMLEKFGRNSGGNLTSTDTIKKKWIPEFKKRQNN